MTLDKDQQEQLKQINQLERIVKRTLERVILGNNRLHDIIASACLRESGTITNELIAQAREKLLERVGLSNNEKPNL